MALVNMETKFCKLPIDFGALLSEDVENSRLESCSEIESIDQFIELLISTAPGEHTFDKKFGCKIFILTSKVLCHIHVGKDSSPNISLQLLPHMKRD